MARGFVGYEAVPGTPDALNFQTGDGRSVMAFGPEAMALKRQLDSSPRPLFAGPGATGYEDQAAGMSLPGQPPPAPPQTAAPAQLPSQATGQARAPNPTGDLGDYLTKPVYVGGSAGVTRQQLQSKATQGVATPQSSSAGVEGGFAPSADYLENVGNLSVDERLAHQAQADEGAIGEQRRADMYRNQYEQLASKESAAADHAAKVQAGVARQEQVLMTARQSYSSAKVDPERIYSGVGGTIRAISSGIASALGAYAATVGKAPNFAQGIIDNAIERDIRAQEAEIRIKGESSQNALQDLMRTTGDMETAKSALRIVQQDRALQQVNAFAADSKSAQIKRAAEAWSIEQAKGLNTLVEDYRQKSLGKVTQQVQQEVLYPRAGSAGYYRDPNEKEVATRAGTAKTVQEIGASRANVANTEADTALKGAQAAQVGADAAKGPEDPELKKSLIGIANHKAQIAGLAKKYGYEIRDGRIVEGKDAGFPMRTSVAASAGLDTDLTALGVTFAAIANNDKELGEAAKAKLTPRPTERDSTIVARIQSQLDYLSNREGAIKGISSPGAVDALERNQAGRGASIRAKAEGGVGGASGAPAYSEE